MTIRVRLEAVHHANHPTAESHPPHLAAVVPGPPAGDDAGQLRQIAAGEPQPVALLSTGAPDVSGRVSVAIGPPFRGRFVLLVFLPKRAGGGVVLAPDVSRGAVPVLAD